MEGLLLILIYYKDGDGNIIDYMKPPDGWTMGQINQEIENFNRLHDNSTKAYTEFFRDNSLGAYLAEKAKASCIKNERKDRHDIA